ncbi:MAG: hypothetical protein AseanaTS_15320 [Candidatus Pelagadaptatus aseana]|uniref:adenosylcobinamide amidohydrolase n=1 Tax=Candidatus Pelagadaptatus aseana TaxID=3120508 RepID=UPI0039B238F7
MLWREQPMPGVSLEKSDRHIYCELEQPREVFSSAILNGGFSQARGFVNLKVANQSEPGAICHALPSETLAKYCQQQDWPVDCVGMMTAASMNSLRFQVVEADTVQLLLLVTTGLGNARRAGDSVAADLAQQSASAEAVQVGTINTAVISNRRFSAAALAEMMTMATEAKCAALQDAGVVSPVSGQIATGTGTDSVAIFNGLPDAGADILYCGKHTLLGQVFAQSLMALITDSISWQD